MGLLQREAQKGRKGGALLLEPKVGGARRQGKRGIKRGMGGERGNGQVAGGTSAACRGQVHDGVGTAKHGACGLLSCQVPGALDSVFCISYLPFLLLATSEHNKSKYGHT